MLGLLVQILSCSIFSHRVDFRNCANFGLPWFFCAFGGQRGFSSGDLPLLERFHYRFLKFKEYKALSILVIITTLLLIISITTINFLIHGMDFAKNWPSG